MKKLFLLFLCLTAVTAVHAQKNNNPLSYPYYICGTTEIDPNDGTVILKNISYKGFSCKQENYKTGAERNEKAEFQFEEIKTNPAISLAGKQLQYWRQDEYGAWITDAEGGNGIAEDKLDKYITIMLVLDCSRSLGAEFGQVQKGAISFIEKLYQVSADNYVRFGIIGFSSISKADKYVFDIMPLNSSTKAQAEAFINSLNTKENTNTALYYAVNKAVDMLDAYVTENFSYIDRNSYDGTYMLTFTDGIDNASQFRDKKIFKSKEAYEYAKNKLVNSPIKGSYIESYIIGARGVDLKTPEQITKFKNELEGLIPDGHSDRFTYLENMHNLESTFTSIAEGLVKRWQNLYCYTSLAHEGGVCWTLGEVSAAPVYVAPKPAGTDKKLFLGVNAGAGFGMTASIGPILSFGVDFAYPITNKFGLGAYLDYKGSIEIEEGYASGCSFGIMTTVGNYSAGRKSFVGGLGIEVNGFGARMANFRAGSVFKNGLYLMGDISAGTTDGYESYGYGASYEASFAFTASVKIGFNFGKFIRVRKGR